jgi:hypothetical protein
LPAEPRFHTRTEELVWRALRSRLRACDVLLHGVRLVGKDGDWEADLVLLMPEGFATIEVRAARSGSRAVSTSSSRPTVAR